MTKKQTLREFFGLPPAWPIKIESQELPTKTMSRDIRKNPTRCDEPRQPKPKTIPGRPIRKTLTEKRQEHEENAKSKNDVAPSDVDLGAKNLPVSLEVGTPPIKGGVSIYLFVEITAALEKECETRSADPTQLGKLIEMICELESFYRTLPMAKENPRGLANKTYVDTKTGDE